MASPAIATAPLRILIIVKSPQSDEEIIKAFLRYARRSDSEYEKNQHYIHLDPDRRGSESWSHLVLDMDVRETPSCNSDDLHLEIYKVKSENPEDELRFKLLAPQQHQQYYRQSKDYLASILRWGE
ncbi:hypothetical protein CLAIMM_03125 [Cladophialophora immunda]|nr:hypothetical protein CLAIMM_03125 [Cladophialophora immunda]